MIVVDASLAAKWFLAEADSEQALALLERHEAALCGPALLGLEVSSAIVAAVNARRIPQETGATRIAAWLARINRNGLNLRQLDWPTVRRAADIAFDLGHPLADCLYLALAIDLDCDLVTCDEKFQAKAAVAYPRVKLLADFS